MNFLQLCDHWLFPDKNRLNSKFQEINSRKYDFSRLWDEGKYDELLHALDKGIMDLEELRTQANGHGRLGKAIDFKISRYRFRMHEVSTLLVRKAESKSDEQSSSLKSEETVDDVDRIKD